MVDTKRYLEVASTFSALAAADPAATTPVAEGAAVSVAASLRGVLYVTPTSSTGLDVTVGTEDSVLPVVNPVGTFNLGVYRTTLPTYANGDAAMFHFDVNGKLMTAGAASAATTGTQTTVAGSTASTPILVVNSDRLGATIFNDQSVGGAVLYLRLSATAATTVYYTTQIGPLGYYEVPAGYTGAITGIWSAAQGNARITELT